MHQHFVWIGNFSVSEGIFIFLRKDAQVFLFSGRVPGPSRTNGVENLHRITDIQSK